MNTLAAEVLGGVVGIAVGVGLVLFFHAALGRLPFGRSGWWQRNLG